MTGASRGESGEGKVNEGGDPNPFTNREPQSPVERLLLFEWAASHYESLNKWLPPVPPTFKPLVGMDADGWHGTSLRLAVLRKFVAGRKEGVRLDLVWEDMLRLNERRHPNLTENLQNFLTEWDCVLSNGVETRIDAGPFNKVIGVGDFFDLFNYGLVLHADSGKALALRMMRLGTDHGLWNVLVNPKSAGTLTGMVLNTLATIRQSRQDDYFPGLPDAWTPIWPAANGEPALGRAGHWSDEGHDGDNDEGDPGELDPGEVRA